MTVPAARPSRSVLAGAALLAAAVALAVAAAAQWWQRPASLPVLPPSSLGPSAQHVSFGPIRPPVALPPTDVVLDDGSRTTLAAVLEGRWTLLQLMFASCTTTCPLQGAIFAATAKMLEAEGRPIAMLSVSIDPGGDSPAALGRWLADMEAGPGWRAALPTMEGLGPLVDALGGRGQSIDVHLARAYVVDPRGRLVYATEELPDPAALAELARQALASP